MRRKMGLTTVCHIGNQNIYQEILNDILELDVATYYKIRYIIWKYYPRFRPRTVDSYASLYLKFLREDEYIDEDGHPLYRNVNVNVSKCQGN